jgi:hypothetical protein
MQWLPEGQQPARGLPPNRLGDYTRPEFAALYKPEGLQWLFERQLSVRGIPYALQGAWVVDPRPVTAVAFDPQFFPFQATDLARVVPLSPARQGDFAWSDRLPDVPAIIIQTIPTTIGGIGRWTTQFPREPKKKLIIFTRNMENRDRADIEDIMRILKDSQ